MRCPNCQSDQDDTHFYCASCGQDLHHFANGPSLERLPDINFDNLLDQNIEELKKQARNVEVATLENIQDRAAKWAKTNLFFLGLASSVLILAFSFFGYKKITDLEKLVAEKKEVVNDLVQSAQRETDQATAAASKSLEKAQDIQKEIESVNIEGIQQQLDRLNQMKAELDTSIRKSERISSQLTAERENVQKLQHSFFTISAHIDDGSEALGDRWDKLVAALNYEGFQLNRANVVEIGTDRTEILYYNELAREQAEIIADIVQQSLSLPSVPIRMLTLLERNPREILIKLDLR